ncbi:MAG: UTP--glucose-1-phosphate uridylyltransferase [Verrucomicrobia bacterium]|nr:UTP--glucose-1-phosphate uridylyltransferase [Verrucomicrobiota bacterium]
MEIKKAVITAAGQNQRSLPLQTLVDRDGQTKSALAIIVEESVQAGIDDICVVINPGDQNSYRAAAGAHGKRLAFVEQTRPLGYGHAVWCAREFTGAAPFLLLVGDHLYISRSTKRCAQQLVETAAGEACTVSAVQATHESKLPHYGTVGGRLADARQGIYLVSDVVEKPTPTEAEQRLIVPGLRAGHYLCFFGMHVLTPRVMSLLEGDVAKAGEKGRVQLSAALARLAENERYLACELDGRRFDIGVKYGLLTAQLALALSGEDRDEVLAGLVELLALSAK